jgi:hypothetical protein
MISITLPSVHPEALVRTLANLRACTNGSYEVIVVSPFEPPGGDNIIWIPEDKPKGPNVAHGYAAVLARGDYVLGWVDDHLLTPDWDKWTIRVFEGVETVGTPALLGLRHVLEDHVGTVFGHYYAYFPFVRRETVDRVGWLGVGEYQRGFADCDLGMRVWSAQGYCTWGSRCVLRCADDAKVLHDDEAGYEPEDLQKFLRRWRFRFGKGWPANVVRDFNIDVVPEQMMYRLKLGTLKFDTPAEMWG